MPFRDVSCLRGTPVPVLRLLAPSPMLDPLRAAIARMPPMGPEEDDTGTPFTEDTAEGTSGRPDGGTCPLMGCYYYYKNCTVNWDIRGILDL